MNIKDLLYYFIFCNHLYFLLFYSTYCSHLQRSEYKFSSNYVVRLWLTIIVRYVVLSQVKERKKTGSLSDHGGNVLCVQLQTHHTFHGDSISSGNSRVVLLERSVGLASR